VLAYIYSYQVYYFIIFFIVARVFWIDAIHKRTFYELFADRLIGTERFLNDERMTFPLEDAEEVSQSATLIQKYFEVGDIVVRRKGSARGMILRDIENPNLVFEEISAKVAELQNKLRIATIPQGARVDRGTPSLVVN